MRTQAGSVAKQVAKRQPHWAPQSKCLTSVGLLLWSGSAYNEILMTKSKIIIASLAGVVVLVAAYAFAAPWAFAHMAEGHVHNIFNQEAEKLTPAVSALVGKQPHDIITDCYDSEHTSVLTHSQCTSFRAYDYDGAPFPASQRSQVVDHAKQLDKILADNGWMADRQQDKIKTVADDIPASALEAYHGNPIAFHKNIGAVSCNLRIDFSGPTDGASPGVLTVDQFSCQQDATYLMPHMHPGIYGGA